jgi:HlyD family secretion protein
MRKTLLAFVIIAAVAASAYGYYVYTRKELPPTVSTARVTRGDIAETVGATGQLQAVTTVQVGTQVSGTLLQLNADFNSLVHKGQVLARLDPSLFQTQIEQARANLIRAQADLERLRVSSDDSRTKLSRAQELADKKLIAPTDLEAAQVAVRLADAQIRSQQAAVTQAEASLQQNQVNLDHTIIQAPIDGLVISRNVDVGQTVAASMSAPTLFVLAADLTKMQVVASLDESDVGRIRPGQVVRFRVDAYPNQEFTGAVTQVRLQPQTVQNVVTYSTVIDVPNPELKLKPGMTANVNIEIARRNAVLRVPNAALRFRPTTEIFDAFGQTPPAGGGGGAGGRGGRGRGGNGGNAPSGTDSLAQPSPPQPNAAANAAPSSSASPSAPQTASASQDSGQRRGRRNGSNGAGTPPSGEVAATTPTDQTGSRRGGGPGAENAPAGDSAAGGRGGSGRGGRGSGGDQAAADGSTQGGRGGFGGGRGGGRGNFADRMANMTPEERQQFTDRMRARGAAPPADGQPGSRQAVNAGAQRGGGGGNGGGQRRPGQIPAQPAAAPAKNANAAATTIDALFGPLPVTETSGQVWLFENGKLARVPLRLGITDGQQTALIQGDLNEDEEVVSNITTAAQRAASAAAGSTLPIFGQQGRGGFPGGGGGGGGPRGGGGARGGR